MRPLPAIVWTPASVHEKALPLTHVTEPLMTRSLDEPNFGEEHAAVEAQGAAGNAAGKRQATDDDHHAATQRLLGIMREAAVAPVPIDVIFTRLTGPGATVDLPDDLCELVVLIARVEDQTSALLRIRMDDIVHLEDEITQLERFVAKTERLKEQAAVTARTLESNRKQLADARGRARRAERQLEIMQGSLSWRITRPLRALRRLLQGQG